MVFGKFNVILLYGTGTRTAEAYEGDVTGVAVLHIEYSSNNITPLVPVAITGPIKNVIKGNIVNLDGSKSYSLITGNSIIAGRLKTNQKAVRQYHQIQISLTRNLRLIYLEITPSLIVNQWLL